MSDVFRDKEKALELAKIDSQIQKERTSRAEAKRLEKEARKAYGRDWKKILGMAGNLMDPETKHSLYSINPQLREFSKPNNLRRI